MRVVREEDSVKYGRMKPDTWTPQKAKSVNWALQATRDKSIKGDYAFYKFIPTNLGKKIKKMNDLVGALLNLHSDTEKA